MLNDVPRTEAYQKAILGNRHLFDGKIVMDVGAGTGNGLYIVVRSSITFSSI